MIRVLRSVVVVACIGLALGVSVVPSAAAPADDARQDARHILGDRGSDSGGDTENGSESETGSGNNTGSGSATTAPDPSTVDISGAAPIMKVLAYAIAGLVVVALALGIGWVIIRAIRNRAPRTDETSDDDDNGNDIGLRESDPETVRASGPDELDRLANEAEANGDYRRALRFRFRAGVLRLAARGRLQLEPSTTVGAMRRQLELDTFDRLSGRFDEIVYGDHHATPADVDEQRAEWPRVLAADPVATR